MSQSSTMFKKTKRRSNGIRIRPREDESGDVTRSGLDMDETQAIGRIRQRRSGDDSCSDDSDKKGIGDESSNISLLAQLKKNSFTHSNKKLNKFSSKMDEGLAAKRRKMITQDFDATSDGKYRSTNSDTDPKDGQVTMSHDTGEETKQEESNSGTKIYKGTQKVVNKFHAQPIKAPTNVRRTCRFDYQPDICKDYKDTGFCGFGDTCIYLHDRGDTLTGWQIDQQYEQQKQQEKARQEEEMNQFAINETGEKDKPLDDGIPFKCYICREAFNDPIVTTCGHYFCTKCIMKSYSSNPACPVCLVDTGGVFNNPTKLLSKKQRIVGRHGTFADFAKFFSAD